MNFVRVIPRDLFNEAKLLKCIGLQYWLAILQSSEDAQQLAKEAWQAWVKTIGTVKPTHNLRLCDHADGVRGHYCIGKTLDGVYYAYWAEHQKRWATAGTVYTSKTEAEAKLRELT